MSERRTTMRFELFRMLAILKGNQGRLPAKFILDWTKLAEKAIARLELDLSRDDDSDYGEEEL